MSSLHKIVAHTPLPPSPHFIIKPSFTSTPHDGFTSFSKPTHGPIHAEEEEDVDILDDEDDESDLEDEEDESEESSYASYHHHTPSNAANHIKLPSHNTHSSSSQSPYLSINHIISPNTPQLPPSHPQAYQHEKERKIETPQPTSSSTFVNEKPSQGNGKKDVIEDKPLELLRENRQLRKKVEGLMGHNMQLMLGIKERDHRIYKQKRLLVKYRKALLRFFEENETSSSSDDELANMSPNEAKAASKKEAKLDAHLRSMGNTTPAPPTLTQPPPPLPTMTPPSSTSASVNAGASNAHATQGHARISPPASPSSPVPAFPSPLSYQDAEDKDDESIGDFEFEMGGKKRKNGGGEFGDLEPDKKRRGPRRNALWTPEDDEMFQKVYNVYGKSWKTIHNYMPGKTREQVQSHGQYLIRIGKLEDVKTGPRRGRKSKKDKEKSSSSPVPHHSAHHSSSNHATQHPPQHSSHHSHHSSSHHSSSHHSSSHHVSHSSHHQNLQSPSQQQALHSPSILSPSSHLHTTAVLSFSPSPTLSLQPSQMQAYDE